MPFKSKSQQRFMFAAEERGDVPKGTAKEWAHKTKDLKHLPEKVKKTASEISDEILDKLGAGVAAFRASPAVGRKELLKSFQKKPAPGKPPEQPQSIEWRKSQDPKPTGEMLKFFSLKEGQGMGLPTEKPFMQQSPAAAASRQLGGTGMAGSPAGGGSSGGGGRVGLGSVDPAVLEASLMRAEAGPSKIWQGLTGLSDDILAAGMRAKKNEERRVQKHAAQQLASSVSMLTKMSEVARSEVVDRFFLDSSVLPKVAAEPDKLEGGKADDKPASDFDSKQVAKGEKVEKEHTNDPALATEIAKDHLEEIPDYYDRLKKMEDAAPKKEAGLLPVPQQEQPISLASPLTPVSPDILQLIKAQALIDQQKLAQSYDTGDVRIPYQREQQAREAPQMEQNQADRQAMYEQQLAEQMRAQRIEHEYTGKVRRGELAGGLGGLGVGAGLGYLLSKPGGRFFPMAAGGALGGLLGKGLGRHFGQQQGLDYLQQYSGVPWAVQ